MIAVEHSHENLPGIFESLKGEPASNFEVIVIDTMAEIQDLDLRHSGLNVTHIRCNQDSRIPHLWARGIRVAKAPLVATTTAHCLPEKNWLGTLLNLDLHGDVAGVGGAFRNAECSAPMDWAIYFQRYRMFTEHLTATNIPDIAADNAVYRRAEILNYPALLDDGFWEPEFHAQFRRKGLKLLFEPALVVIHKNRYSCTQFARQRLDHGRAFGEARARRLSLIENLLMLAISPALGALFFSKIIRDSMAIPALRWNVVRASIWISFFVACWTAGEAMGYLRGLNDSKKLP